MHSVNIIGRGKGWENAPLDEYSWGITLTNLNRRVDLVIDMNVYDDGRWGEQERQLWLKSRKQAREDQIPYIDLSNYPIDAIVSRFRTDYFTNTVDYAIALAIYRGFKRINLYGINMANGSEYSYQKPGVEFWIGMALGQGINVSIQERYSTLLQSHDGLMYGYDTRQTVRIKQ